MPNATKKLLIKKALPKSIKWLIEKTKNLCSKKPLTRSNNEYTLIITMALKVGKSG
jgi:hypothetical protein